MVKSTAISELAVRDDQRMVQAARKNESFARAYRLIIV